MQAPTNEPGMAAAAVPGARNLTRHSVLARNVEVADGLWGKFMGLMGRPSLTPVPRCGCRRATGST